MGELNNIYCCWCFNLSAYLPADAAAIHTYSLFLYNLMFVVSFFPRSGYDHVLLLQYLVPRLFELKELPIVEKRGTRVTSICTRSGIQFRDVAKLLAPSTNLRSFGKLFGLEQAKAHFPFSILQSVGDLNIASLPEDDDIWRSEITGENWTTDKLAEMKREAQALFEKANCSNVGDYLKAYLYLDVDILYRATQAWRRQLYDLVKMDFIECGRFTISGLSYSAGLKSLEARKRLGNFFPNNSQMYRLLRKGMRG